MRHPINLSTYDINFGLVNVLLSNYLDAHNYSRIGILVDELTFEHCLPLIRDEVSEGIIIQINSGEKNKILATCEQIWTAMAESRFDRHSLLINLGGGVIGDMGGFAASCYMRGLDFIQIPTTLLSQVDASVGGKLAIDYKGYKNFIGLFRNPRAVLIDPNFLQTLSSRELRSGYAEMIKHGLIKDIKIWDRLRSETDWRTMNMEDEIYESVLIKKDIVEIDPQEKGVRKILNFGHTIGHAIESLALVSDHPLLHGEAIALGMIAESILSRNLIGLPAESVGNIIKYIRGVYSDVKLDSLCRSDEIIEIMQSDKKNKDGTILFSLLEAEGKCTYDIAANEQEIAICLSQTHEMLSNN